MNILIGSRALALQSGFAIKTDTDWDIVSDNENLDIGEDKLEVYSFDDLDNYTLQNYLSGLVIEKNGEKLYVLNLPGLAMVKRSHLWRDWKFERHMTMYNRHLKQHAGMTSEPYYSDLWIRTEASYKFFKETHPNLNVTVPEFFDDAVEKVYEHDWLHELFAHEAKPLYTQMQPDPSKAWCSSEMWEKFSYARKIQCIQEEAYVIATERFIVKDRSFPHKLAYYRAVNKICTTLCSGWFRDFAIDNYENILDAYNPDKIKNVLTQLK